MLSAAPVFSGMQFDGRTVTGSDYIESTPRITVAVTGNNLVFDQFQLHIDGVPVLVTNNPNYTYSPSTGMLTYYVQTALGSGLHTFQASAVDGVVPGSSIIYSAFVAGSDTEMEDKPIVYPSPATASVRICYTLTHGTDVDICIYDLKGQMVYNDHLYTGMQGAHAGYNEYRYDLKYADGRDLPNGVFVLFVVQKASDKTTILGKRKFMVLRDEK